MKENIIFLLLYLLTEFVNYLLAYEVFFQSKITKKRRNWIIAVGIVLFIHGFLLLWRGIAASASMSLFTMTVIPLLLLRPKERKNIFLYPFIVIATSIIAVCFSFIIAFFKGIPEAIVIKDSLATIICQGVPAIVLILLCLYRRKKGIK